MASEERKAQLKRASSDWDLARRTSAGSCPSRRISANQKSPPRHSSGAGLQSNSNDRHAPSRKFGGIPAIVEQLLCQLAAEYEALQGENTSLQENLKHGIQPQHAISTADQVKSFSLHTSRLVTDENNGRRRSTGGIGNELTISIRRSSFHSGESNLVTSSSVPPSSSSLPTPSSSFSPFSSFMTPARKKSEPKSEPCTEPEVKVVPKEFGKKTAPKLKRGATTGKLSWSSAPYKVSDTPDSDTDCKEKRSVKEEELAITVSKSTETEKKSRFKKKSQSFHAMESDGTIVSSSAKKALAVVAATIKSAESPGSESPRLQKPALRPRIPGFLMPAESMSPTKNQSSHALDDSEDQPHRLSFYMVPTGRARFWWDVAFCMGLLVDFWVTLFSLIFLGSRKSFWSISVAANTVTAFFCVDMVVNFRTAYIDHSRLVVDCGDIAKKYMRKWFWFDLFVTIPWSIFLPEATGIISLFRAAKISNLKSFGYFWTLHCHRRQRIATLAFVSMILTTSLFLLTHIHACCWEIARMESWPDIEDTRFDDALSRYYESFWWAFTAFMLGSRSAHTTWSRALEMFIAAERFVFFILGGLWGVFQVAVFCRDSVRVASTSDDALSYMREHGVDPLTQLEVAYNIELISAGRSAREHFYELASALQTELQQKISFEMWNDSLLSLELIEHVTRWHDSFMPKLVVLVGEDTLASGAVLYMEGEVHQKTCRIISGRLVHDSTHTKMPDFVEGMWVGEMALVNMYLPSGGTLTAKQFCILMSVPVAEFHHLVGKLELSERLRNDCCEQLWKGLCGRCGAFGSHFSHECPTIQVRSRSRMGSLRVSNFIGFAESRFSHVNSFDSLESIPSQRLTRSGWQRFNRDLQEYLHFLDLEHIAPALTRLNIWNLEQLETSLSNGDDKLLAELTLSQEDALTLESIDDFRKRAAEQTRQQMNMLVPKQCLIFLSHYKVEAGTEAALIREELQSIIDRDGWHASRQFETAVFLDSENLTDLDALQQHVVESHNLVLLLTKGVLLRPWVLVEILTAVRNGVPIIPMNIVKPEAEFVFPDDEFYERLHSGAFLDQGAMRVLQDCQIDLAELEKALRTIFKHIAVSYSPHRAANIRQAELEALLREVKILKDI